ncbi:MAG: cobaltochelatase subunit CobN [Candidatus Entotheonella factor]|uniref:Cobaltochelatase subunit CobN n=2 Tax=Candidatus Entotheonella TaxID=93171 RepID=W4L8K3_ENTF1|nr:MAG: cobaltochelatase subunit CobN [Candidatus Entotheonella factor]
MIVYVTTADTEILALSRAVRELPDDFPALKVVNPNRMPETLTPEALIDGASMALVRLLGGRRAWEEGFDRLTQACIANSIPLLAWSGEQHADAELTAASTALAAIVGEAFEYLRHGGVENVKQVLRFLSDTLLMSGYGFEPPSPLPEFGVYHPAYPEHVTVDDFTQQQWQSGCPTVGVLFYRTHWMSGNRDFIDALVHEIEGMGCNVLPIFCYSLRSPGGPPSGFTELIIDAAGNLRVDCLVSTLSYSMGTLAVHGATVAEGWSVDFLDDLNVPIIQAVASTSSHAEWEQSDAGLTPLDTAMTVAIPEFDGRIISVPFSFKEVVSEDETVGGVVTKYVPVADRVREVAGLAMRMARLRHTPQAEKRIAVLLSSYPTKAARIGNAVGLDSLASLMNLLEALRAAGYDLGETLPSDGDDLIQTLIARGSYDKEFLTEEQLRAASGQIRAEDYQGWFAQWPQEVQTALQEAWGEPPGQVYRHNGSVAVVGLQFGNVFVGIQPPRGFGENPVAIYHDPDLAPSHHYLGTYHWLKHVFQADAIVHMGKHGTLEWLPGKGIGLSGSCYPDVALGDMPLIYPFIINDPGEGTQAKRRAHAIIVDHLIPAMMRAETYNDIARLEQLLDEYYQVQTLDPSKLPVIRAQIWELIVQAELHHDLHASEAPDDFDDFLLHVDGYLCEIKDAQIRDGLHTLGQTPEGEQRIGLVMAMLRLDNGSVRSLRHALADLAGLDYSALLAEPGVRFHEALPAFLTADRAAVHTHSDVIETLEQAGRGLVTALADQGWDAGRVASTVSEQLGAMAPEVARTLRFACEVIVPSLERTPDEINNILRALDGEYIPAGPSGAPTRGLAHVLPTGRNFYSVDPKTLPSPIAYQVGTDLANSLIEKYLADEGAYPESIGIVVWGTSAMRTHGDDIAEVLALLGVRPVWQEESRRVTGIDVIPLSELGRPRIDVTLRISGFFRDAFPNLVHLVDEAIQTVAGLDEPPEQNFVRKHVMADRDAYRATGVAAEVAQERSLYRIFGSKPGTYGAGILPLLDERNWRSDQDLAEVYMAWGGYAYTKSVYGSDASDEFKTRFAEIVVAVKNQDNREHDIFDSDDYLQYHGGMVAAIRALSGRDPKAYFGDSSDPSRARVRALADEARRVFRTRVVNPKWIESMQRHGYKGAFEMAATVDYMYGYDATAQVIDDWMYEQLTDRYVLDAEVQEFFREKNPWALRNIIERLMESVDRGLWQQPDEQQLEQMRRVYLQLEGDLEDRTDTSEGQPA